MKKLFRIVAVLLACVCLIACGSKSSKDTSKDKSTKIDAVDIANNVDNEIRNTNLSEDSSVWLLSGAFDQSYNTYTVDMTIADTKYYVAIGVWKEENAVNVCEPVYTKVKDYFKETDVKISVKVRDLGGNLLWQYDGASAIKCY